MRCRPHCLDAATLVDRDIDNHGPGLHARQIVASNQLWRLSTGNQHRADDEVRRLDLGDNVVPV